MASNASTAGERRSPVRALTPLQGHYRRLAFLLIIPCIVGLCVFRLFPILTSFVISWTDWNIIGTPVFVGWANYHEALTSPLAIKVLRNTAIYASLYVPCATLLGLALALLVNSGLRGVLTFRTLFFLPVISATVAVAITWQWIFSTRFGILNGLLAGIGIEPMAWLGHPDLALLSIAIVTVWKDAGFYMILFVAALQSVNTTLIEAARVEGAGRWQILRHVILPQIAPMTFFVILIALINSARTFEVTIALTGGGPNNASTTLGFAIYQNAFVHFDLGLASAQSWILCVVVGGISLLHYALKSRLVDP